MSGMLAHELQHLAGHDPLPHTATQTARNVLATTAAAVLVGCAFIVLPTGLTEALALDVPLTGIAWTVGAVTTLGLGAGMWLGRRHAIRTADQRPPGSYALTATPPVSSARSRCAPPSRHPASTGSDETPEPNPSPHAKNDYAP